MNEHGRDDHEPSYREQSGNVSTDNALETRISRFLHKEAEKIHFTPALRHRIMQKVSAWRPVRRSCS